MMQATYCDLCGKRIRSMATRKEMPIMYTDGARWIESDICIKCVDKLAKYCAKLKEDE